ncbi:WD40 repeat-like protein [Backusella circina FSU 941]|nr:WD40 repeat-like protein [Backusella circina FSU 941]
MTDTKASRKPKDTPRRLESRITTARDTATNAVHSAREWLTPNVEWPSLSNLESLSTVMFSPLAAHPVYRSESMMRALKLMQQHQHQRPSSSSSSSSSSTDLVLHGNQYAWPSSTVLLQADIPETTSAVSLFQGFAATYPSLARSPKRSRQRRKRTSNTPPNESDREIPKSLTQIISQREKRVRESDKISMQKSSTANEIDQVNLQINELLSKRKVLEQKWEKLEAKELEIQIIVEELNEAILDIEESGSTTRLNKVEEDSDEDVEAGVCFKTLHGHTDEIICLDFNHPKGILVSSSMDGTVKAWDLQHKKSLGNLEGHTGLVKCLQLDDARLLTGADDGSIKYWDLSNLPDTNSVFSSSNSSSTGGECTMGDFTSSFSLEGHQGEITAFYADHQYVVSGSSDKTMKQWDLETQECMLTLDVMWACKNSSSLDSWLDSTSQFFGYSTHDFIGAVQFWDFALASGTSDGKIRMWDLRTGQAHRTLPGHNAPITCLQFDEVHLVSGSMDKTIKIWDLRTGSVFDTLTYTSPISSLQFDAAKIISSGTSSAIDIYNRTSFQHSSLSGHTNRVNTVRFHKDVLATAGADKVIKLWSL